MAQPMSTISVKLMINNLKPTVARPRTITHQMRSPGPEERGVSQQEGDRDIVTKTALVVIQYHPWILWVSREDGSQPD